MITVINGSPNKDSKTYSITSKLVENQRKHISIFNPYKMNINSCDDCTYCHHKDGCIKRDDMQSVYNSVANTETLIISSPIYFGHFTDQTMKVINRFQKYFSEKWIQKKDNVPTIKNLVIVSTAGHNDVMFEGLHITISILEKLFSTEHTYLLFKSHSESTEILDECTIKEIDKIKMGIG